MEDEAHQKQKLEEEIAVLQSQLLQLSFEADEVGFHTSHICVYMAFKIIMILTRVEFTFS